MADVVSLSIDVDSRRVMKANDDLDRLGFTARKTGKKINSYQDKTKRATKQTNRMSTAVNKLRGMVGILSAGIAGVGIVQFASQIERATTQMNNINATMRVATGSAQTAGLQIQFIREEAQRLGLFFPAVAKQMAQFSAAARTSSITGEELREIFTGISEASRAMGLTAPQTEGAMQALQQMMSKGKVSAEELRQQLGERMPGSIQIMASALDVTTSKLFEMMENGRLLSDEVLPKFGRELQRVFGAEASEQANKIAASIQRLRNSIFDLMAQDNLTGAADAINRLSEAVGSKDFQEGFDSLVSSVSSFLGVLAKNLDHLVQFVKLMAAIGAGSAIKRLLSGLGSMSAAFTSLTGKILATNSATVSLIGGMTTLSAVISRVAWPIAVITSVASAIKLFADNTIEAKEATRDWVDLLPDLREDLTGFGRETLSRIASEGRQDIEQLEEIEERIDSVRNALSQMQSPQGAAAYRESSSIRRMELERELETLLQAAEGYKGVREQTKRAERALFFYRMEQLEANAETEEAIEEQEELRKKYRQIAEQMMSGTRQIDLLPPGTRDSLAAANAELEEVRNNLGLLEGQAESAKDTFDDFTVTINSFVSSISRMDLMPPGQRDALASAQVMAERLFGQTEDTALSQKELLDLVEDTGTRAPKAFGQMEDALRDVGTVIKDDISNGLTDIIMQAESAKDVFEGLLDTIARTLIQRQIVDPFVNSLYTPSGGGLGDGGGRAANQGGMGGGDIFSTIAGFIPGFANGGNVRGGQAHIVGERGPEMFVPRQDGQIVPNSQMGGGGGDVTVNIINQSGERLESQEQNRRRGPNGEQTIDVMVKSSMERLDSQGQLDGIFRRHGAKRQGQF